LCSADVGLRGGVVEAGEDQQALELVVPGDPDPLLAVGVGDHDIAVGVREDALGASGGAAGEAAQRCAAIAALAGEGADLRLNQRSRFGRDGSRQVGRPAGRA
jgi:hypothetical protein